MSHYVTEAKESQAIFGFVCNSCGSRFLSWCITCETREEYKNAPRKQAKTQLEARPELG